MQTKYLPLALFSAFCLKTLYTGCSYENVATLAVLGLVAFLYEKTIQNNAILAFRADVAAIKAADEAAKKELESIKAYVSSLKLNNIRSPQSGFNRTAQP